MTRKPSSGLRKRSWLVQLLFRFCTHPLPKTKFSPLEISVDFGSGFVFKRHFVVLCSWCQYILDAGTQTWGEAMGCSDCEGTGVVMDSNGNSKDCKKCKQFDE